MTGTPRKRIFHGWWIVSAFGVINMYVAGFFYYGFGAIFNPIISEFGWSRAATSLAFSLERLEGGISAPIVGLLFDRIGPRRLVIFGSIIAAAGFFLLSRTESLAVFYLSFVIISTGVGAASIGVGMATVANWFTRLRGRAMGFLLAWIGAGGLLVTVLVIVINLVGWRGAVLATGIGFLAVCLPLSFVMHHKPEDIGLRPDGDPVERPARATDGSVVPVKPEPYFTLRQALRTRAFWMICLVHNTVHLSASAVLVHFIPNLVEVGISRETAALGFAGLSMMSMVGRVGLSWISDSMDKRYVTALALLLLTAGALILPFVHDLALLAVFIVVFAPGYGGATPVRASLVADYFGRRSFGSIHGMMLGVITIGSIIGPTLAGWIFDVTGGYQTAYFIVAGTTALAIPVALLIKQPGPPAGAHAGVAGQR